MIPIKRKIPFLIIAGALASCSNSNDNSNTDGGGAVTAPLALEDVGQEFLLSLTGIQVDQLSLAVRELAVEIAAAGDAMPLSESTFETLDGFGPEVVVSPTQITAYTCNTGGLMTHETGRLRDGVGTERSLLGDYDAYTFDACRYSEAGDAFASGDYQLDGELVMDAVNYSASRGGRSSHSNSWTGFAMSIPADIGYELSGSVAASACSAANFGTGDSRTVELPMYRKNVGTKTTESLEYARLSLTRTIPNGSDASSYQLNADGTTVGPNTGDVAVTINTDPPLSGSRVNSQGMAVPFNGQIRMVVADGGELIITANPASQISIAPGDLLVDLVALRPNGESIATDSVPLIDILSGSVDNGCFLIDAFGLDCGTVELP